MIDTNIFTVFDYDGCVRNRIGSNNDGGYVIIDNIGTYGTLISGGVGDNTTFEKEFTEKYSISGLVFDNLADALPHSNSYLKYIKQQLNSKNNLADYICSNKDIFLKLDIEGWEYFVINSWTDDIINNIKQYVIEFHAPYFPQRISIIQKLLKNHTILHIHANNCCGCTNIGGVLMPIVLEITAVRKDLLSSNIIKMNNNFLPLNIDQKNVLSNEDIVLNYPPFCHETV